jgi:hypothetical protein
VLPSAVFTLFIALGLCHFADLLRLDGKAMATCKEHGKSIGLLGRAVAGGRLGGMLLVVFVAAFSGSGPPKAQENSSRASAQAPANGWYPADPDQISSKVAFTLGFAKSFTGAWKLADLQKATGAGGKIKTHHFDDPDDPYIIYNWDSEAGGTMMAVVRPTGQVTATIRMEDRTMISFNNEGSFMCHGAGCPGGR